MKKTYVIPIAIILTIPVIALHIACDKKVEGKSQEEWKSEYSSLCDRYLDLYIVSKVLPVREELSSYAFPLLLRIDSLEKDAIDSFRVTIDTNLYTDTYDLTQKFRHLGAQLDLDIWESGPDSMMFMAKSDYDWALILLGNEYKQFRLDLDTVEVDEINQAQVHEALNSALENHRQLAESLQGSMQLLRDSIKIAGNIIESFDN